MKIVGKVELERNDYSEILDMMGHTYRAKDTDEYQKLVPFMEEAVQRIANRAFEEGREFERKLNNKI